MRTVEIVDHGIETSAVLELILHFDEGRYGSPDCRNVVFETTRAVSETVGAWVGLRVEDGRAGFDGPVLSWKGPD